MYPTSPFTRFSKWTARTTGHPRTFLLAVLIILAWTISGPLFHFSDTWQLVINTGTTIVTFLMVFLIQNTQNRDSAAIQLKLDELLRASQGAHNALLDLEELTDAELDRLRATMSSWRSRRGRIFGAGCATPGAPMCACPEPVKSVFMTMDGYARGGHQPQQPP